MAKAKKLQQMTEAQFFKELAKLKKNKWHLQEGIAIRCKKGDCPVIAVAKAKFNEQMKAIPNLEHIYSVLEVPSPLGMIDDWSTGEYEEAGKLLGLPGQFTSDIVAAADETVDQLIPKKCKKLRRKLEATLLLK